MRPPDAPSESDEILPWAERVTEALQALWPQPSGSIVPEMRLNGTSYSYTGPKAATAPQIIRAFTGLALSEGSGPPEIKLWVAKGTVNDWDEAAGMEVTGAGGTPPDSYWEFSLSPSTAKYLVANVTLATDGSTTAVALTLLTTPTLTGTGNSTTGAPPTHAYRKLLKVTVDGDYKITITQYTDGAQQCAVIVTAWACNTVTKKILWLP